MLEAALIDVFPAAGAGLAQVGATPFQPLVLLILCLLAGVGTVLLLPSRLEAPLRKIGGVGLLAVGLIAGALLVRWSAGSASGGMGVYFWIFSAVAIVASLRVITHTQPVYSALYFVLTVFASAGLFVLLWAEFMAVALVLIYAGAILVTYVFVIMLAYEASPPGPSDRPVRDPAAVPGVAEHDAVSREPIAACAVGFALMGILLFVIFDKANALERGGMSPPPAAQLARQTGAPAAPAAAETDPPPPLARAGAAQQLGAFLFQSHLVNLQMAGLILTLAMVGAIVIARKRVISEAPAATTQPGVTVTGPFTPVDDNPHSIPVYGTLNPRQKEYPES